MPPSIARRTALAGSLLILPALATPAVADRPAVAFAELERRSGGRLGVAALDTADGRRIGHRANERFPMSSTFKFLAAALVLIRVDQGEERLDRRIVFSERDLVDPSPVTARRAGLDGMSLAELCEAAVTRSDKTAGNLLLSSFGGPAAITAYARTLGDNLTRLDRIETALNEATPGDPRDTTVPNTMLGNMQNLLVGEALSDESRERLVGWLMASAAGAGARRLRAGLPGDWRVGDKTGNGGNGTANDIAIAWPTHRAPILIAAYFTGSAIADEARNAVIAEVGRLAAAGLP